MIKNLKQKNREHLFIWLVLAIPLLQFLIFYVYVNFEQILMSFQEWVIDAEGIGGYRFFKHDVFSNYTSSLSDLFNDVYLKHSFWNSITVCLTSLIAGSTLALVFSSYIAHRRFGSQFFKIILFIPNMVSMVVLVNIFVGMNDRMIPALWKAITGQTVDAGWLIKDNNTQFGVALCFSLFFSFGVQVLSYSGAISSISQSITEAATLDGCGRGREFLNITVPMIWPTIITFITLTLVSFFTNQVNLVAFYGSSGEPQVYTYGYYMFVRLNTAIYGNEGLMPKLATLGIIFSVVSIPIVFAIRHALIKLGPSVD